MRRSHSPPITEYRVRAELARHTKPGHPGRAMGHWRGHAGGRAYVMASSRCCRQGSEPRAAEEAPRASGAVALAPQPRSSQDGTLWRRLPLKEERMAVLWEWTIGIVSLLF